MALAFAAAQKPAARAEQKPPQAPAAAPAGDVTIRRFRRLHWSPAAGVMRADGGIEADYTDSATGKVTTLTAPDVIYDTRTGRVTAASGFTLTRPEGTFTGRSLDYNLRTHSGAIAGATVAGEGFRLRGAEVIAGADGTYVVSHAWFTTCDLETHPDYHIVARSLRVRPGKDVTARGITFYAGRTPIFAWPTYKRSLTNTTSAPTPTPGYNKAEGYTLRFADTPVVQPNESFTYDARLNIHRAPAGNLVFQRDLVHPGATGSPPPGLLPLLTDPLGGFLDQFAPPTYQDYAVQPLTGEAGARATFFAVAQSRQFVYNRRRSDLRLSRFPELGFRYSTRLGAAPPRAVGPSDPGSQEPSKPGGLLDVFASAGEVHEEPTRLTAGRFAFRTAAATPSYSLSPRVSVRAAFTGWLNVYSTGTAYELAAPELAFSYTPTATTFLGVGYRYLMDAGRTPFRFDRRDIRHELRLQYHRGGPWGFGAVERIDLERGRAYDAEFAVTRNFDCMQVGVAYRVRSQSFAVLFSLLPARARK